jgi:DNA-directed RNA polymerase subunit M/transcription elongation factor TFIIS
MLPSRYMGAAMIMHTALHTVLHSIHCTVVCLDLQCPVLMTLPYLLQLRSADEGQTVFFTCVKCKYKESENS